MANYHEKKPTDSQSCGYARPVTAIDYDLIPSWVRIQHPGNNSHNKNSQKKASSAEFVCDTAAEWVRKVVDETGLSVEEFAGRIDVPLHQMKAVYDGHTVHISLHAFDLLRKYIGDPILLCRINLQQKSPADLKELRRDYRQIAREDGNLSSIPVVRAPLPGKK